MAFVAKTNDQNEIKFYIFTFKVLADEVDVKEIFLKVNYESFAIPNYGKTMRTKHNSPVIRIKPFKDKLVSLLTCTHPK